MVNKAINGGADMLLKSIVFLLMLFFPCQSWAAEPFSVFEARPTALMVETDGQALNTSLQQQLLLKYQWAFRFPQYEKQPVGGFVVHKKGEPFLQDRVGNISVATVRDYMKSNGLQRLALLRIDELSSFVYHDFGDEEEIEDARVHGVATLVDQEGNILLQRRIHYWEKQFVAVDSGPDVLLLKEWDRFLEEVKKLEN